MTIDRIIDDIDLQILALLQDNARISNAEMARQVGLAPSATLERLRKLEGRGLVRGYTTRLAAGLLGYPLLAFVFVRSDERIGDGTTGARLAAIPEVQEVHHIAGEDCYLVKVRAADPEALGRLLREGFGAVPAVRSTRTTIVLETIREDARLPLPPRVKAAPAGTGGDEARVGAGAPAEVVP
jgi:Lrp/AsnC family transcriptional regulator, leucine-responsive regulatory protein